MSAQKSTLGFWHENLGWLYIDTGINEIQWSYGLNTAKYATYGGEVVQILSVDVGDVALGGEIKSYAKMEEIYKYFVSYMTLASQGNQGTGSYNQKPMHFHYYERNWLFYIQPLTAPEFIYSRETVAPSWNLTAHVVDYSGENYEQLSKMITQGILNESEKNNETFKLEGIISLGSADPESNPFASPVTESGNTFNPITTKKTDKILKEDADFYNTLLPQYISGDYKALLKGASQPAFGQQFVTKGEGENEAEKKERAKEVEEGEKAATKSEEQNTKAEKSKK